MTNKYYAYVLLRSTWIDVNVARSSFRSQDFLSLAQLNGASLNDDALSHFGFVKKPREFRLISPSRHLCYGRCVAGITVQESVDSDNPLYMADEPYTDLHISPSIWGELTESSPQSNFCAGIVDRAKQWLSLDDSIDCALIMDKTTQPPRGDCAVSCETSIGALVAQLDIEGEFDPKRLFLLQGGIQEGRTHQHTLGRHEGKLWEYKSDAQAASQEPDRFIYYNCSKDNDLDSDEVIRFPLVDITDGLDDNHSITTHFCHVAPDGTITSIGS